jgi:hypothetical protein
MRNIRLRHNCNNPHIIHTISKYAKYDNFILVKLQVGLVFVAGVLLIGCLNTEGTLLIKGKVMDERTKVLIPHRAIIVKGLVKRNNKLVPVDACHFSTDSSGCFTYSLKKVKDAYYYNFYLVGDSDYASVNKKLGLLELGQNARYLQFSLSKLVGITIKICRKSKIPQCDTLYLSWESNGVEGRNLYPYIIDNFGMPEKSIGLTSELGLRWIGGNVNSTVRTRVFADKRTKINWELARNRRRQEITDTITCRRDFVNLVRFVY